MARSPRAFPIDRNPPTARRTLASFPSVSSPGHSYEIRESIVDGFRYCTCWPWIRAGHIDGDGCPHFGARPDLQRSDIDRARRLARVRVSRDASMPLAQLFPAIEERVPGYVPPGERLEID